MRTLMLGAGLLVVGLALTGCVKRKETITVKEDGSATWRIEVSGDKEDMSAEPIGQSVVRNPLHARQWIHRGVPILAEVDGWSFSEKRDQKRGSDDKVRTEIVRTVEKQFDSVAAMPNTYPSEDAAGSELALQHPTSLTLEHTADGTYYHFRRTYEPRESAYVNYWYEQLYEEYGDVDEEDMTDEDTRKFVRDLVRVEELKQIAILQRAETGLKKPLPHMARIAARDAVATVYGRVDEGEIIQLLELMDDDNDENGDDDDSSAEESSLERMEALARDVENNVMWTVGRAVRGKASAAQTEELMNAFVLERRRYEITEDYEDEAWEIHLALPGKIVGHNANKVEDGQIVWEMGAGEFMDRRVELLATSFVAGD